MPVPFQEQIPAALQEINAQAATAETAEELAQVEADRAQYEADRAAALGKIGQSAIGGKLEIDARGMVVTAKDKEDLAQNGPEENPRGWR